MIDCSIDTGNPKQEEGLFWFEHYQDVFELHDWEIHIRFQEMDDDINESLPNPEDVDQQFKGCCWSRPEYRKAHIDLDVTLLPMDAIRTYCRHEMIHVVHGLIDGCVEQLSRTKAESEYARISLETNVSFWEKFSFWDLVDEDAIECNSLRRKKLTRGLT